MIRRPRRSTLFPYTTLFQSQTLPRAAPVILTSTVGPDAARGLAERLAASDHPLVDAPISGGPVRAGNGEDRKSTRLNSSHANISYAVFCLKKNITTSRLCSQ